MSQLWMAATWEEEVHVHRVYREGGTNTDLRGRHKVWGHCYCQAQQYAQQRTTTACPLIGSVHRNELVTDELMSRINGWRRYIEFTEGEVYTLI